MELCPRWRTSAAPDHSAAVLQLSGLNVTLSATLPPLRHTHTDTHRSCPVRNGTRVSRRLDPLQQQPRASFSKPSACEHWENLETSFSSSSPPPHPKLRDSLSLSPFLRASNERHARAFTPYVDPECDLRATSSDWKTRSAITVMTVYLFICYY